jgi:hypothetical protein
MSGGRRRIDKVLADDFTTDLEAIELGDLRGRRREAEQEEADLSYVRRMLQGRMDILRAELARRSGGSDALADDICLPSISTVPDVGVTKPAIIRSVVVLPQPDGPSSETNSPDRSVRSRLSTTVRPPNFLVRFLSCSLSINCASA